MKTFLFTSLLSAVFAATHEDAARSENSEYWASYLQNIGTSLTPPPTPGTPPPTPAPAICVLDISLECEYVMNTTGIAMPCEELPAYDFGVGGDCFQDLTYTASVCNNGTTEQFLYEFAFMFGEDREDFLEGAIVPLEPSVCLVQFAVVTIDRCNEAEYCAKAIVNGTNPMTGIPSACEDEEELCFVTETQTTPPTAATPPPTVATPPPTVAPVPTPPVSCEVVVDIVPTCPNVTCEWNRCVFRPFRMEFRVVPVPCSEIELNRCPLNDPNTCACDRNRTLIAEEWPDQKVFCIDNPDGNAFAPNNYSDPATWPELETYWVVATPEKDPSLKYFEGPIAFGTSVPVEGNSFNATDPNLERVEANTYLRLYTDDPDNGGLQLQEVLFHSSCSEELWLFDIYASFQLVEYESVAEGITGSFDNVNLAFNIDIDATSVSGELVLEAFTITLLPEQEELYASQTTSFDVAGVTIPPPFTESWGVSITPEVPYIAVTIATGTLDGKECISIEEKPVFCPRTIIEGETPPSDIHTPGSRLLPFLE